MRLSALFCLGVVELRRSPSCLGNGSRYTLQLPQSLMDQAGTQGQIATLLGGRSAEETVFGSITTGASNDLQRATDWQSGW